jgi:hypothetical protein
MKLEYYVFPSSDAFFLACCLASNQALLFSGRPIPRFHVISTPNNQLFPLLVHLIMFSESSRMKFFSFKTPTQDPHAWSHYDAAGVRSLDNDIHDWVQAFGFTSNQPINQPTTSSKHRTHDFIIIIVDPRTNDASSAAAETLR